MKLRRLEKEYNEVINADIQIKDANKFEGLAKIFGIEEQKESEINTKQEMQPEAESASGDEEEFDEFGEFQTAEGTYQELGSDSDNDC